MKHFGVVCLLALGLVSCGGGKKRAAGATEAGVNALLERIKLPEDVEVI